VLAVALGSALAVAAATSGTESSGMRSDLHAIVITVAVVRSRARSRVMVVSLTAEG
jgi:hypothetical protein